MKRWLTVLAILVAVLIGSADVKAHEVGWFALATYKPDEGLVIRLVDAYFNPVEGVDLTAEFRGVGNTRSKRVKLKPEPPATFTVAKLPDFGTEHVEVRLQTITQGEYFRAAVRIDPNEEMSETVLPLLEAGVVKQFPWALLAGVLGGGILLAGAAVVLRRRRRKEAR